jgi:hypothetical protein
MKMNKSIIVTAFASMMLLGSIESATAQGNFVFNGCFDSGVTGWTASNVSRVWDANKGNPGGFCLLIGTSSSTTSSISQTISGLTPGMTYLISGDFQRETGDNTVDNSFGVSIDGNILYQGIGYSWQSFSFYYTATSSSALLSLLSQLNGTEVGYGVDNISFVAVPEPSSLCLLGVGGAAGLFFLRRKVSAVRHGKG